MQSLLAFWVVSPGSMKMLLLFHLLNQRLQVDTNRSKSLLPFEVKKNLLIRKKLDACGG